ncbi:MAG: hypothetical protein LBS88_04520 [Tannerellaceae bacterium]|jgi:hypothetical protein|nr:hypothetical protein [Tannerellaceae bacterium]
MKAYIKKTTLWLLFALPLAAGVQAQVSVGSLSPSEPAALLQIKEYDAPTGTGGVTANKGGFLLPRVALNSVSDVTVIPGATPNHKSDITGLLVYNVSTSGEMEEGIYEWDGTMWAQLETTSKTSGSSTLKSVKRSVAGLSDGDAPVEMGIFEFRIDPLTKQPQYKFQSQGTLITYQIACFWDYNTAGDANTTNSYNVNATMPAVGYTYNSQYATGNDTWQQFYNLNAPKADQRFEVWIADPANNYVYNVHFIYAQHGFTNPVYAVLVTQY